jgi:nitrite reductase/ring-hydroxylating ferredoxin subunit
MTGSRDDGWIDVLPAAELPMGEPTLVTIDELAVLLFRSETRLYAMANRCTHAGGPLHRGRIGALSGEPTVTCPLHGSMFRMLDGRVIRGPATRPEPVFEVREHEGTIQVRDPG